MGITKRYSPEGRERAVRLVFDHELEHDSQWGSDPVGGGENRLHAETLAVMGPERETNRSRRTGGPATEGRLTSIRSFETRDNSGISGMPTFASGLRISSHQLGPDETIPQTHRGPHGPSMIRSVKRGYRGH